MATDPNIDEIRRKFARELRGRIVREAWVAWAHEQPDPKPSWLEPWELLGTDDREAGMRIGDAIAATYVPLLEAIRDLLDLSADELWPVSPAGARVGAARAGAAIMLDGCSDPRHVGEAIRDRLTEVKGSAALTGATDGH